MTGPLHEGRRFQALLSEFRSCSPCHPALDPGGFVSSTNGTAGQSRVETEQFVEMNLDHATGRVIDTSEVSILILWSAVSMACVDSIHRILAYW